MEVSLKKARGRTFTIPDDEFQTIKQIQARCWEHKLGLNDSEVVRAAIAALIKLKDRSFLNAVKSVSKLQRGRPVARKK